MNIIKHILGAILGFLLAITFFKELFILVPLLITVVIVYILKNKAYYKKSEFLVGIAVFVLTHSHWYLSLYKWVGIKSAGLIWVGISLYFFLLWYLFFYLLKYLLRIQNGYFLIPIYWTLFEWLLSLGIFGYPFMSLYLTQAGSAFQWLSYSIIMSYSVTFYLLIFSTVFALIITGKIKEKINIIFFATLFFVIFVVAMNAYLDKEDLNQKTVNIAVIQSNITQTNKINDTLFDEHLNKYFNLINKVIKEKPETEIIVLPENIIPALWEEPIKERLCFSTNIGNRLCVFGQAVKRDERIFNAMLFYKHAEYITEYHKQRLVPFGEYLPFLSDWINLNDMIYYYPGGRMIAPINIQSLKIAPLVCFESAFPSLLSSLPKFNLGIIVTNDAWFNKYFRILHLRTVQFRAIERLTPFAFSANNGITALIDSHGKILSFVPDNQTGFIFEKIKINSGKTNTILNFTFYLPVLIFLVLMMLVFEKIYKKKQ